MAFIPLSANQDLGEEYARIYRAKVRDSKTPVTETVRTVVNYFSGRCSNGGLEKLFKINITSLHP